MMFACCSYVIYTRTHTHMYTHVHTQYIYIIYIERDFVRLNLVSWFFYLMNLLRYYLHVIKFTHIIVYTSGIFNKFLKLYSHFIKAPLCTLALNFTSSLGTLILFAIFWLPSLWRIIYTVIPNGLVFLKIINLNKKLNIHC